MRSPTTSSSDLSNMLHMVQRLKSTLSVVQLLTHVFAQFLPSMFVSLKNYGHKLVNKKITLGKPVFVVVFNLLSCDSTVVHKIVPITLLFSVNASGRTKLVTTCATEKWRKYPLLPTTSLGLGFSFVTNLTKTIKYVWFVHI